MKTRTFFLFQLLGVLLLINLASGATTTSSIHGMHSALIDQGVQHLVFAERRTVPDGHWYANIGYYAPSTDRKLFAPKSRLCLLDVTNQE
ncbi:MAG: hypothetical protein KJO79_02975, partial [Verrucomicrobiae bacterium]|nr:hypothetical protein [Verrucomicrobiae bacterium]NNJ86118.1 hypothetical protein [Akkermansiaceae bacterium]